MNHLTLARICQESYHYVSFNLGECEAIIKYYDDCQVIAFRGTEAGALFEGAGWLDVVRDMRVIPWYDNETGWVHAGFLKGGRRAAEFLADKLDKDLPIYCTGHSLGGALALMCAVKLFWQGFNIEGWVGFGSPKTQLSTLEYGFTQWNYRHKADIVPLMPRFLGYRHNYPVVDLRPDPDRKANWDDHGIDLYIKAL